MPEDAAPESWHSLYWDAWDVLRFDRQYGAMGGELPIPYMAISQYARDHGIVGDEFRVFRILLSAVDTEWLTHVAEKARKAEK